MLALLSLCAWSYLFFAHGSFWRSRPQLSSAVPRELPEVDIIVPARDEAETIQAAIASLLGQDYAGTFRVLLIDDNSTDGTAALAGSAPNLEVIRLDSKPPGWSGKLWALHEGVAASRSPIVLFTDADIVHQPAHLASLLAKLLDAQLDMVSEMVLLNCESVAERLLVPAFVYFFQMLYPFAKVNNPRSSVAAAAGGTVLIRRAALERIGGIAAIKDALIDDVALGDGGKTRRPHLPGSLRACRVDSPLSEIRGYLAHDLPNRLYSITLFTLAAARDDRRPDRRMARASVGSGSLAAAGGLVAPWLPACLLR